VSYEINDITSSIIALHEFLQRTQKHDKIMSPDHFSLQQVPFQNVSWYGNKDIIGHKVVKQGSNRWCTC